MNNEKNVILEEITNPVAPPVDIYVKKTDDNTYVIVPDATDADPKDAQYKVTTNDDGSPKDVVDLSIKGGRARRIRKTKKSRGGKARRFKSRRH